MFSGGGAGAGGASVSAITIVNGGSNYTNLTAALPAAYGATQPLPLVGQADYNAAFGANYPADAYARIMDLAMTIPGPVMRLQLLTGGSGYTSVPTVAISGGNGTGATAAAAISGIVNAVTVTRNGSGYLTAPIVVFTGGGGCCAAATANLAGSVASITVT